MKGQVEELISFKGDRVLPVTQLGAMSAETSPHHQPSPVTLVPPRSLCFLSWGHPAIDVWKKTEGCGNLLTSY